MIVYSWKQFWNNFNNGDEWLFQDADRPRDSNMFKIQHWIQTGRQDLRTANSWIAAQGTFYGVKVQTWGAIRIWETAALKNKYTASDFPWLDSFVAMDGTTYSAEAIANGLKPVIIWRPYVNADWDIVIWKSGVYAVTCQCLYVAPTWYDVSSTTFSRNSAYYKFYVSLMLNWVASMWTQSRGCGSADALSVFYVWWFDTWDRLNTGFFHTYTASAFLCQPTINLYRLS